MIRMRNSAGDFKAIHLVLETYFRHIHESVGRPLGGWVGRRSGGLGRKRGRREDGVERKRGRAAERKGRGRGREERKERVGG